MLHLTECPRRRLTALLMPVRFCVAAATAFAAGLGSPAAHAQRDLTDIPAPDPAAELAAMQVADGFEASLFAGDEHLSKPIHMNFGADGKLWVATSTNYPQLEPGDSADDKILMLQDTDGDGVCDRSVVFADGLLIPTGVLPALPDEDGQGVYVAASTQLLYFRDTDGDDVADERRIVLDGFGTEDTHHLLHTLRWGPDGCLYMNQSIYIHSHVPTREGTKRLLGGGIWRYEPKTDHLSIFCKGFINPWGHAITAEGQSFVTDGAYFEGINHAFPGAVFATSPGATRVVRGLNPGSPKHCGLEIDPHSGNGQDIDMVTADFRSHRVNRFRVSKTDTGYSSAPLPDLIRSEHVAFRPIDIKLAPNGDMYIADWYNPIIQHGEVDFRDPRRDKTTGRIWKLQRTDADAAGDRLVFVPKDASTAELLAAIESSPPQRQTWLRMAIAAKWGADIAKELDRWISAAEAGELQARRMLHASWIRAAAGELTYDDATRLLDVADPRLRAMGLRLISTHFASDAQALAVAARFATDPDWLVRLEAVSLLQTIREETGRSTVAPALAALELPLNDEIDFALWQLVRSHDRSITPPGSPPVPAPAKDVEDVSWLNGIQPAHLRFVLNSNPNPDWVALVAAGLAPLPIDRIDPDLFAAVAANGSATVVAASANRLAELHAAPDLAQGDSSAKLWTLTRILASSEAAGGEVTTAFRLLAAAAKLNYARGDQSSAVAAGALAAIYARGGVSDETGWVAEQLALSEDAGQAEEFAAALARFGAGGVTGLRSIATSDRSSDAARFASIRELANADLDLSIETAIEALSDGKPLPTDLLGELLNRKEAKKTLQKRLTSISTLPPAAARTLMDAARQAGFEAAVTDRIAALGSLDQHRWELNAELIQSISSMIAAGKTDPGRGELIYRQESLQCVRCHKIGPAGGDIGPNLVSLGGASQLDYVIESLIVPDAKLKEGYKTVTALLESDRVVVGLEKSRTEDSLTLQQADGQLVELSMDEIADEKAGGSLMPPGLVDKLSIQELSDLTDFLSRLGRTSEYTVDASGWIRSWSVLQDTPPVRKFFNRNGVDKVAEPIAEAQWVQFVSNVDGRLPLAEAAKITPYGNQEPIQVFRAEIDCKRAGSVRFEVHTDRRAIIYLDGSPVEIGEPINLSAGEHRIVSLVLNEGGGIFGLKVEPTGDAPAVIELANLHRAANNRVSARRPLASPAGRLVAAPASNTGDPLELRDGDTLAIIGDDLWEQIGNAGVFEAYLRWVSRPKAIHVRNMSWAGDDVTGLGQSLFGGHADGYQRRLSEAEAVAPDIVLVSFGRMESLDHNWNVERFIAEYERLLNDLDTRVDRVVVALPPELESGPTAGDAKVVAADQRQVEFREAIRQMGERRGWKTLSLPAIASSDTRDGFRLSDDGLIDVSIRWAAAIANAPRNPEVERSAAAAFADLLAQQFRGGAEADVGAEHVDAAGNHPADASFRRLLQLVLKKRERYFNTYRPQNETYLLLFRKHEQGNNAGEIEQMRALAVAIDREIDQFLEQVGKPVD